MTRADVAVLISGVALGVSVATFLWRIIYDIYFDAPRIKVKIEAVTITAYGGRPPIEVYLVTATNVGKRPTTLTSLWLCFGRSRRWWWRIARRTLPATWREKLFAAAIMMPDAAVQHLATRLPGKLDAGEQAHAYYSRSAVHESDAADEFKTIYGDAGFTHGGKASRRLTLPG